MTMQPEAEGRALIWSRPLRRWVIRRLILIARCTGLTVTAEDDGNLLYRMHLITVRGESRAVARWYRCVRRVGGAAAGRPRRRR